jgi:glycosyltransferase involved in cell wall biosynthesis
MKIYIVTVCRNAKTALSRTIASIRPLRGADVHFSVIDGNSGDGTPEMLASAGSLVDYWVSEPDDGIYDAMNKGLAALPLEEGHVIFIGAGDRLLALPSLDQRIPGVALYGDVAIGERIFRSSAGWRLKAGNTLHHQGLFLPRLLLRTERFDCRYRVYADLDLSQRLMQANVQFVPIESLVAIAEPGGVSWSASPMEMIRISRKNGGLIWGGAAYAWAVYRALRAVLTGAKW